jgi:uncharacterized protein YjiK
MRRKSQSNPSRGLKSARQIKNKGLNGTAEEAAEKVIFAAEEKPQGLKPYRIFSVLRHD